MLTWFVPMIWLTGGLERYVEASGELADTVVMPTSIVGGPVEVTAAHVALSARIGAGRAGPAGGRGAAGLPWYVRRYGWGRREWFLIAWTVPPVLVYTLVHFGQAGYVLTFLPALVILLSRVLLAALGRIAVAPAERAARRRRGRRCDARRARQRHLLRSARPLPRDFDPTQAAVASAGASDEAFDWIFSRTAAALREHEEVVRTFVDSIRGPYPPEDTAIITEMGNPRSYPWLRHAMFYLPEYAIYELRVGDVAPGYYAPAGRRR